jgi:sugar phosphate isomerase/epimerase
MRIGCNTLYTGGGELENTTDFTASLIMDSLARIRAVGYEAVEFSHAYHLTPDEARAVGDRARELGLLPWSVHAEAEGGFILGDHSDEAAANLIRCIEVCAAIGARVVVAHVPIALGLILGETTSPNVIMRRDLGALRPALERAAELDVEIALENGKNLDHFQYVLALLEELQDDHLGICVDTGHAHLGDLGAPQAIRLAGNRLLTTHLHDNMGQRDDHMPPATGTINWADTFAALRAVGYDRVLQLELTDRPGAREYDQEMEMRWGLENTRLLATEHLE